VTDGPSGGRASSRRRPPRGGCADIAWRRRHSREGVRDIVAAVAVEPAVLDDANDRFRTFKCGATDLVAKPVNTRELVARIAIHPERRLLIEGLTDFRSRLQEELQLARRMQADLLPSVDRIEGIRARYGVDVPVPAGRALRSAATCGASVRSTKAAPGST
jgi:hypothetical protein